MHDKIAANKNMRVSYEHSLQIQGSTLAVQGKHQPGEFFICVHKEGLYE